MKFANILTMFGLVIIIIQLIEAAKLLKKKDDAATADSNFSYNNLINRGYSFLNDNFDIMNNPTTMIAPNNIFSYQIDLSKVVKDETYKVAGLKFDAKKENSKSFKYIQDYNVTEIADANAMTINSTDLPVMTSDFFYKRGKAVKDLHEKNTLVYVNELKKAVIEINTEDENFPKFNDKFLTDTLKVFGTELINKFCDKKDNLNLAYDYLRAYGTHFIHKIKFGCKTTFVGEFLKPKNPDGSIKETEPTVIKAGKFDFDDKIKEAKRVDKENDIMIKNGNCNFDAEHNEFKDTDDNYATLSVIGMNIKPLYDLFTPGKVKVKNLKTASGVTIDENSLSMIYNNMKSLISGLATSMDIRNAAVSDFNILNNLNADDVANNACLKPRKKLWKNKNGSVFGEHFKNDCDMPIYSFVQDTNKVKYKDIVMASGTNGESSQSTYGCLKKSSEFNPEIIYKSSKHQKTFIEKIYFKTMDKLEKGEEKNCTIFWTKAPKQVESSENIIHNYLCVKKTNCAFDDYITDLKMLKFSGGKCENSLNYLGRKYTCICDYNMLKASNSVASDGKYLCYSMKIKAKE